MSDAYFCDMHGGYVKGEPEVSIVDNAGYQGDLVATTHEGKVVKYRYPQPTDLCRECWAKVRQFIEESREATLRKEENDAVNS